jgi:hypothetical protein
MNLPRVKLQAKGMHQMRCPGGGCHARSSARSGLMHRRLRCRSTKACCSCSSSRSRAAVLLDEEHAAAADGGLPGRRRHHRQPGRHEAADADSHCSAKPVRFVLEMNQGWFAKRGIKAGFKLTGGRSATGQRGRNARQRRPGPCRARAQAKLASREVPVHQLVEEGLDELRAQVAVVDVVGVFPHVHRQQALSAVVSGVPAAPVLTMSTLPSAFLTSQVQPEPKLPTALLTKASLKAA